MEQQQKLAKVMKTEKFFFQIRTTYKGWDETAAFDAVFSTREQAVEMAKKTAALWGAEVRMTDNEKLLQGSYFSPDGKI
jgi:hypothetical protein